MLSKVPGSKSSFALSYTPREFLSPSISDFLYIQVVKCLCALASSDCLEKSMDPS